jgi:hypothetical protein
LAFSGAAGYSGSLFFCRAVSEFAMRMLLLAAVTALSLAACKNNNQHDNSNSVDENLTAENIVSNDVTAIDAVTGDDANMAADVNYMDVPMDNSGNTVMPVERPMPSTSRPSAPRSAPSTSSTSDSAASNNNTQATSAATGNSE